MPKRLKLPPKEHKYPLRACRGCSMFFFPDRADQVYHENKCREAHYNDTYYKKTETTKACLHCGNEFQTTKPKLQDYCKPSCRKAAALKRASEKEAEYQRLKNKENGGSNANSNNNSISSS